MAQSTKPPIFDVIDIEREIEEDFENCRRITNPIRLISRRLP